MKAKMFSRVLWTVLVLTGLVTGMAQAASLPPMHVGRVQASYAPVGIGGYSIQAMVTIHDLEHMPVPGATVVVGWVLPNGAHQSQQAVTDFQGKARFQFRSAAAGAYQVCVTNVTKIGWVYNSRLNHQTCASVNVIGIGNVVPVAPVHLARLICINGVCPPPTTSHPVPVARLICINGACPPPTTSGPVPVARLICINGVCPPPSVSRSTTA